jgi:hypothetical protein
MSHKASAYVKTRVKARSGDRLTTAEKLLLWYVADCYNDDQRAAWCSVRSISRDNGLSERRVREILNALVQKQELWREARFQDSGREQSNYWRFWELDGEPPSEVKVYEEKLRVRGEIAAGRANETKRARGFPQDGCGEGCDSPQGTDAEDRILPCESSQGEDARVRRGGCESSHPQGCESSQGEDARVRIPIEHAVELPVEPPVNCTGTATELLQEPPQAAAVEKNRTAIPTAAIDRSQERDVDQLLDYWILMLTEMAQSGQIEEKLYLRMCVETTQLSAGEANGLFVIRVGVSSARLIEQYVALHRQFNVAARMIGLDPSKTRLEFESIEKVRRA